MADPKIPPPASRASPPAAMPRDAPQPALRRKPEGTPTADARSDGALPLSRARIAASAVALARRDGVDALTMRQLAAALEAGTMSLYRHVKDRQDLLIAMLDHVAQAIAIPPPLPDARRDIAQLMLALHRAFRSDPWVVGVLLDEGLASRHIMPLLERVFSALDRLGVTGTAALQAYGLLIHYSYGESLAHATAAKRQPMAAAFRRLASEAYPASARAFAAATGWPRQDYTANIDRILVAIGRPDPDGR
ncbi:MAG: TetR/AcrR family transcriptional regulator [Pseudomonadota bacterium]